MKLIYKILLVITIFIASGCSAQLISVSSEYDEIVEKALKVDNFTENASGTAFTYYIPHNMQIMSDNEYVTTLKSDTTSYYLSVNIVNYLLSTNQIIKTSENEYEAYSKEKAEDAIEFESQLELIESNIVDPIYEYSDNDINIYITNAGDSLSNIYIINEYAVVSTSTNSKHTNEALFKAISLFNSININDEVAMAYVINPPNTISSAEIISIGSTNETLGVQIISKYNYDASVSFDTRNDFENVFLLPGEEVKDKDKKSDK